MVRSQLSARGIQSERVLDVLGRIPREQFVPDALADRAYEDSALPIDCEQTISQPFMVARMTELLELRPDSRVLEIGTGSGYQTAVLASLAGRVFSIEWHLRLMLDAFERLWKLRLRNVVYRCGDGSLGWRERGPYDAIIVTAGAPRVPEMLCAQLAADGVLIAPIGSKSEQTLARVRRRGDGFEQTESIKCRFVKLRGAGGWQEE